MGDLEKLQSDFDGFKNALTNSVERIEQVYRGDTIASRASLQDVQDALITAKQAPFNAEAVLSKMLTLTGQINSDDECAEWRTRIKTSSDERLNLLKTATSRARTVLSWGNSES